MAVTNCPCDVIAPQVLALMFEGGIPPSLPVRPDGSASKDQVFTELQRLWEQAITDCDTHHEKEKSK